MKKSLTLLLFISTIMLSAQEIIPTFLEKWSNSKIYLLEVANAMPEENYNFKPTEREMTFAQQLIHIKENMDWLSTAYFKDQSFDKTKDENHYSKQEIISMLEKSFDKVFEIIKNTKPKTIKQKVDFFAGPKTKLQILNLLQDHVTHHRGQILVYLNLNGINPPKYIGW